MPSQRFSEKGMPAGQKIFVPVWQKDGDGSNSFASVENSTLSSTKVESLGRAPLNPHFKREYDWNLVSQTLGLSPTEKEELKKLFKEGEKPENIASGKTGVVFVSAQNKPRWSSRFFFGAVNSKENVVPAWKGEEPGIWIILSNGRIFEFMWKCGNIGEVKREKVALPAPIQPPPSPIISPVQQLRQEEKERVKRERVELYLGAGKYHAFDYNSGGWYGWGQLGVYPFGSFFPKDELEIMPGIMVGMAWEKAMTKTMIIVGER